MTEAVSGFGTQLVWNTNDVVEMLTISGPNQSMDTIEVTSHDSADAFKEFIAGLKDGGEVTFAGNFIKTDADGQISMHTDFQAGTKRDWVIKMPGWTASAPQFSGSGLLTAFDVDFPHGDKISVSGTIKVSGKPVLAVT